MPQIKGLATKTSPVPLGTHAQQSAEKIGPPKRPGGQVSHPYQKNVRYRVCQKFFLLSQIAVMKVILTL
jgi:hypothetical protein